MSVCVCVREWMCVRGSTDIDTLWTVSIRGHPLVHSLSWKLSYDTCTYITWALKRCVCVCVGACWNIEHHYTHSSAWELHSDVGHLSHLKCIWSGLKCTFALVGKTSLKNRLEIRKRLRCCADQFLYGIFSATTRLAWVAFPSFWHTP